MPKARLQLNIDEDLVQFLKAYAEENRTSVTDLITQFALNMKRRAEGEAIETFIYNPSFLEAMQDIKARVKDGTAEWSEHDEVFGS